MHFVSWGTLILILQPFIITYAVVEAGTKKRVNFQPSFMSTDDVISYFKSFITKASSLDKTNEQYYGPEEYSEDLFHKIDNLMPLESYVKWLMKTKEITDKTNEKKQSLLPKYGNSLNSPCNPSSVFNQTLQKILQTWDGDKTIVTNGLEEWQRLNEYLKPNELCNRFRGLTCQRRRATNPEMDHGRSTMLTENSTCQCGGDTVNVGFFRSPVNIKDSNSQQPSYPDGCYIRPWRPCKHLSAVDNAFKGRYEEWHGSLENDRRMLGQMIFPVARTHRCKQGTYCLDMVPGMRKPICWCNVGAKDPECNDISKKNQSSKDYIPPVGSDLMNIRKAFVKLIIPATDTKTACTPEYNEQVMQLANGAGIDPSRTGSFEVMRKLVNSRRTIRICDFREALVCDKISKICKGNLNCGQGKVHLGKGVCVSDNGYRCQSNEDCVQNAKCTFFMEARDSACICKSGYGDECHLLNKPFFGTRFYPLVSGVQDEEYIRLQIAMYSVLEAWEDSMRLKVGDVCDPAYDKDSMEIVDYFGSLTTYDKALGELLLAKAAKITKDATGQLCSYKGFLRCDNFNKKCVPMVGKKLKETSNSLGVPKIFVEIDANNECSANMPKLFEDYVELNCKPGYKCAYKGTKKFCVPNCQDPLAPPKECSRTGRTAELSDDDLEVPENITVEINATTEETFLPTIELTTLEEEELITTEPETEPPEEPTEEAPEPPTEPPPAEKGLGDPCTSDADCPKHKFLECSLNRHPDQVPQTCICYYGLSGFRGSDTCTIPIGEACHESAKKQLENLNYDITTTPVCKQADCIEVNGGNFCRPSNEDGSMFVTLQKLEELKNTYLSKGTTSES